MKIYDGVKKYREPVFKWEWRSSMKTRQPGQADEYENSANANIYECKLMFLIEQKPKISYGKYALPMVTGHYCGEWDKYKIG